MKRAERGIIQSKPTDGLNLQELVLKAIADSPEAKRIAREIDRQVYEALSKDGLGKPTMPTKGST